MKSKHKLIEDHLLSGQIITGLIALDLYGVYRLSSVINRVRNKGIKVETTMVLNSSGETKYAKYWIPIYERRKNISRSKKV